MTEQQLPEEPESVADTGEEDGYVLIAGVLYDVETGEEAEPS